jgi:hypothetical protein
MINAVAQSLADVTISHFAGRLGAVDEAIAGRGEVKPRSTRKGRAAARGLEARRCLQNASCNGGRFSYDVRFHQNITLTVITVSIAIK